jgi:type VI secretion system protein ImpH
MSDMPPLDAPPLDPAPPEANVRRTVLPAAFAEAPHRFGFHALLRLLEARRPAHPRLGRSLHPSQDPIRLGQEPAVTHDPASFAGLEEGEEGRPDRLNVHLFGMFGPDGALPLHITELARERQRNHGDATLRRFIDMFHHRTMSLFHRAWADVRPTVAFDRPNEDRFSHYVGALIGLSTPGLRDRDAMPDLTKLHFAGLLSGQTRHASGLAAILSAFFHMPVRVECFIGGWLTLPPADLTRLGGGAPTAALGGTALLGNRVWSRQHKFRLVFGPISLAEYERLLPGGLSFHRLVPIVRNWAGDALAWDVNMVLRRDQVPATRLGQQGRLGWTTWLMPRRSTEDAADLFLEAGADSHARMVDNIETRFDTTTSEQTGERVA